MRTKEYFYNYYKDRIKDMALEQKIEWLEELKFNIDMTDRWQQEDYNAIDAIHKILKELKGVE